MTPIFLPWVLKTPDKSKYNNWVYIFWVCSVEAKVVFWGSPLLVFKKSLLQLTNYVIISNRFFSHKRKILIFLKLILKEKSFSFYMLDIKKVLTFCEDIEYYVTSFMSNKKFKFLCNFSWGDSWKMCLTFFWEWIRTRLFVRYISKKKFVNARLNSKQLFCFKPKPSRML